MFGIDGLMNFLRSVLKVLLVERRRLVGAGAARQRAARADHHGPAGDAQLLRRRSASSLMFAVLALLALSARCSTSSGSGSASCSACG